MENNKIRPRWLPSSREEGSGTGEALRRLLFALLDVMNRIASVPKKNPIFGEGIADLRVPSDINCRNMCFMQSRFEVAIGTMTSQHRFWHFVPDEGASHGAKYFATKIRTTR